MLHEALISFSSFGNSFLQVSLGNPWVTWPDLTAELRLDWMTFWGPFNPNYPMGLCPHMQRGWCGGAARKSVKQDYAFNQVSGETAVISDAVPGHCAPTLLHRSLAAGAQETSPWCHVSGRILISANLFMAAEVCFPGCNPLLAAAQTYALGLIAPWQAG